MSGSRPNKKAKLPPKDLKGELLERARYSFSVSSLKGASMLNPTSLQFGPDGRLYVAQQDGIIKVLTIIRRGPGDYQATSEEVIDLINQIPNHNDDGSPAPGIPVRQVTGLLVTGTAASPVLYVGSSDSRMGGPWDTGGADPNKDKPGQQLGNHLPADQNPGRVGQGRPGAGLPRSEERPLRERHATRCADQYAVRVHRRVYQRWCPLGQLRPCQRVRPGGGYSVH